MNVPAPLLLVVFDIRPVITVTAIVVLAGIIAFVGDRVGHQVGRRRMTLFGLRPKYTSTIFAVGFGMLIALVVVGIVAWFNEEARQALFSINTLRDEIKTLTAQREQLLQFVREAPLVFRNGEPISRPVIVSTTDDAATIERNLSELFSVVADHYSHMAFPTRRLPGRTDRIAIELWQHISEERPRGPRWSREIVKSI